MHNYKNSFDLMNPVNVSQGSPGLHGSYIFRAAVLDDPTENFQIIKIPKLAIHHCSSLLDPFLPFSFFHWFFQLRSQIKVC